MQQSCMNESHFSLQCQLWQAAQQAIFGKTDTRLIVLSSFNIIGRNPTFCVAKDTYQFSFVWKFQTDRTLFTMVLSIPQNMM